jgi:copper chaperone NosL
MRHAALWLTLAVALGACSSIRPIPMQAGDTCFRCRRPIADQKLAAEIVDRAGRAYKFRTAGCLAQYLNAQTEDLKAVFVTDYTTGRLVNANRAMFVRAEVDPRTGERDYLAFTSVENAVTVAKNNRTSPIDWPAVLVQTRAATRID